MKQFLLVALAYTSILFSCTSTKKEDTQTPMQFSEKIVNMELELGQPLASAEKSIITKLDSSDYENAGKIAAEAEKLVDEKIKSIEKINAKGFTGGEEFKTTAINYFEYVKSIYTNYKNIGTAGSEGARLAEVRRMDTIRANQERVITMMQAAQDKFATDNGFQVDK